MGTTSNTLFNGTSRYSQDLQTLVQRAVSIASLPITQLNQQKTQVSDRSTALSALDTRFQSLAAAITGIENAFGWASYQATVSDPQKLTVTLGTGATEGDYSIQIVNAGVYAKSLSLSDWSATGPLTYKSSLHAVAVALTPSDYSAAGVAAAINSQFGDEVRATVINVGSSDAPHYRISLQGTQLGDLQPDILQGGSSLQGQDTTPGHKAEYIVNGSDVTAASATRTITIAEGFTVNLQSGAAGTVDIQVARSSAALGSALASFANAYNQAVDELAKHHGNSAGALSGDSVVDELSRALRTLSTYSATSGSLSGLAALGLDLGSDGHLTFDSAVFNNAAAADAAAIEGFMGTSATGGFLKAAADAMSLVQQAGSGVLPSAEALAKTETSDLDARITREQERVDLLEQQLQERMAAADALIASMEQQYTYISGMFQAMQEAARQWQ